MKLKFNLNNNAKTLDVEAENLTEEQTSKVLDILLNALPARITPIQLSEVVTDFVPPTAAPWVNEPVEEAPEEPKKVSPKKPWVKPVFNTSYVSSAVSTKLNRPIDAIIENVTHEYSHLVAEALEPVAITSFPDPKSSSFGTSMSDVFGEAFEKKTEEVATRNKQLPAADIVREPITVVDNTDFYATGIKMKTVRGVENTPTYKCRYSCPNKMCNTDANHYLPEGTRIIYCFTCQTKLKVENASPEGFPNRDSSGNFYVANKYA